MTTEELETKIIDLQVRLNRTEMDSEWWCKMFKKAKSLLNRTPCPFPEAMIGTPADRQRRAWLRQRKRILNEQGTR